MDIPFEFPCIQSRLYFTRSRIRQKISHYLKVSRLVLLQEWHVTLRELRPLHMRDSVEERTDADVLRFVEDTVGEESRSCDCVNLI
jgi:hypothetical protein